MLPLAAHLPQFLLGLSSDPVWFESYIVSGVRPGLLPGQPFLDPNLGFMTEALGTLAARDWLHGAVPWWDPFTGVGMPLAGIMQPQAFFLPFNLLLLLPGGIVLLALAMQILAGMFCLALLRELGMGELAALTGACLYALNGTIAWTPGVAAIYGGLPFLPLLLWGIERARAPDGGAAARLAIGVGIAYQILAGFPEAAYLNGMLALAWAAWRAAAARRGAFVWRVLTGGLLGLLVAAPQLIAFLDDVAQSDILATHYEDYVSLNAQGFAMTLLPYVTGALGDAHGSAALAGDWGGVGGYTGVLLPLLALAAFATRARRGLKALLASWLLLIWGRSFGIAPLDWIVDHLPLMRDVEVYRYASPAWGLALVILSACALDDLAVRRAWPFGVMLAVVAGAAVAAWPGWPLWQYTAPARHVVLLWWDGALVLAAISLAVAWFLARRRAALAAWLVLNAFVFFAVPQLSGVRPGQIDRGAVQFLSAQPDLARDDTLGPMLPNYGAYFGLASIDHAVLPAPRLWVDAVDQNLMPGIKRRSLGMLFWPSDGFYGPGAGPRDLRMLLPNYEDTGVRDVIDWPGDVLPGLKLAYADHVLGIWQTPAPAPYFTAPGCVLSGIRRERVTLNCAAPTVLLRRELFMPGWRASVNGVPAQVSLTHRIFQAVPVPAGQSTVRYHFTPPYIGWGWLAMVMGLLGLGREAKARLFEKRRPKNFY